MEFPVSPKTLKSLIQQNQAQRFYFSGDICREFKIISFESIATKNMERPHIDINGNIVFLPNGHSLLKLHAELRPELLSIAGVNALVVFSLFTTEASVPFWIKWLFLLVPLLFLIFYRVQEMILLGKVKRYFSKLRQTMVPIPMELRELPKLGSDKELLLEEMEPFQKIKR